MNDCKFKVSVGEMLVIFMVVAVTILISIWFCGVTASLAFGLSCTVVRLTHNVSEVVNNVALVDLTPSEDVYYQHWLESTRYPLRNQLMVDVEKTLRQLDGKPNVNAWMLNVLKKAHIERISNIVFNRPGR